LGAALPAVPLGLALVGLLVPHRMRTAAAALAVGGAAFVLVGAVVAALRGTRGADAGVTLTQFGQLRVTFGTWLDGPAVLVAIAVGVVALAVQVYSVAYLSDDERYAPYAAQVSLFTAAMLLVVVSGDLIALLIGWEVMGICSYLLIGHDRRLPEAPGAAVKAFLVTRVGDVGFFLGIALLGFHARSFRIADVLGTPLPAHVAVAAAVLLLAGVAGKSAQFPLHTWLPDAMAGPTPISALIHAATMVAAGVYVVARLFPLFERAPAALTVLAVMAAVTMLLGALAAMAQDDIKRVLAWSTVSQLGYMTGALAVRARDAALFHLLTHAAFKALLFLAAGAIIHAVGSNLMSAMGGLRQRMPATFWSMTIGLGALVGLPPLAGFWSKESIFAAAQEAESAARAGNGSLPWGAAFAVYAAAGLTVFLTGFYAMRLWRLTFFGEPRPPALHAHEPPWAMRGPVLALAVPAALVGFVGLAPAFGRWLGDTGAVAHLGPSVAIPLAFALGGIAAAWRRDATVDPFAPSRLRDVLANAFYLDNVQHALVVRPVKALARAVRRGDESIVDGVVESAGAGAFGAGGLLARAHRAALPRAATAALSGAVLIGLVAVLVLGARG
jgi:NADH-quinone oxidoreductase subunit L